MPSAISDTDQQRVTDAATLLQEHFDSVRIFVTRHGEDGETTTQFDAGRGNFYAQFGQVSEWIEIQRHYQRLWAERHDRDED